MSDHFGLSVEINFTDKYNNLTEHNDFNNEDAFLEIRDEEQKLLK